MASRIGSVTTAPREVRGASTDKTFIVKLEVAGVLIREKGRQGWLGPVGYDAIHSLAAKLSIDADKAAQLRPRRKR